MKTKKLFSYVLLIVSVILLFISTMCPICSTVSSLIAIIVAIYEIKKSECLESKIKSYDEAFDTQYDERGKIDKMTIDNGTY